MPTRKPGKPKPAAAPARRAKASRSARQTTERITLTRDQVRNELLAVWDADTWLSLWQLEQAETSGSTLNDVGIRAIEAEGYVNKYNSIIVRTASHPVPVKPSEAGAWAMKKMSWIIDEVFKRSQA